ncbi:MAG: DNA-3-methyladenine glycosylase [Gemmatimonadetes bacterium]|nr:DNA-3-methyladenine glycosylase [Gemmatimonadota bacterium]
MVRGAGASPESGSASRGGLRPPWLDCDPTPGRFTSGFFTRPVEQVARALLGARGISTVGGVRAAGVIVETEAYGGADDPASHAATRAGRTRRNATMFGPPLRAYVYRSYGMHWCVNVVTGGEGEPQAVLLRGLEPLEGEEAMGHRRHGRHPLAAGPGRLCEALGIEGSLNGHDLSLPPLRLELGWAVPTAMVGISGRVGVKMAAERPLRFYVLGSPGVSRASHRTENA